MIKSRQMGHSNIYLFKSAENSLFLNLLLNPISVMEILLRLCSESAFRTNFLEITFFLRKDDPITEVRGTTTSKVVLSFSYSVFNSLFLNFFPI